MVQRRVIFVLCLASSSPVRFRCMKMLTASFRRQAKAYSFLPENTKFDYWEDFIGLEELLKVGQLKEDQYEK